MCLFFLESYIRMDSPFKHEWQFIYNKRFETNINRIYYSSLQKKKKTPYKIGITKIHFLHNKCWLFFCFYLCTKIILEHKTPPYLAVEFFSYCCSLPKTSQKALKYYFKLVYKNLKQFLKNSNVCLLLAYDMIFCLLIQGIWVGIHIECCVAVEAKKAI